MEKVIELDTIDKIISIFGEYAPLTDSNGFVIDGIQGIDFTYIGTVVLFCIFVVFILRIMTIFFKGVMNVK